MIPLLMIGVFEGRQAPGLNDRHDLCILLPGWSRMTMMIYYLFRWLNFYYTDRARHNLVLCRI